MRRILAMSAAVGIALAVLAPASAAGAGRPVTNTYVSVTCFVDWSDPVFRNAGLDGQTEHDSAVITNELWVYDTAGWRMVGTEIDTVRDQTNYRTGVELFRGTFTVESTLGDFAGTFMWTENPSGAGGHGDGHAIDGSGLLWKSTAGVIDPTASGVPACAAEREVYNLTRLAVIRP
jgi:hypothetical protein